MTFSTILPVWQAARSRLFKIAEVLPEQDLQLQIGKSSIGSLLHHTAEVEYMFAEWFFGKALPEGGIPKPSLSDLDTLVALLAASNEHLVEAMKALPEEQWQAIVESRMGSSTPLEAIGRLIYHTGIHAGQISLIQKSGQN